MLWLPQIRSSFWLDETITYWIVSDGLADAIERAFTFGGSGPGFFVLEWPIAAIFGPNEIALRALSVLAMAAAACLTFKIGAVLFDERSARLAALFFVALPPVVWGASDARPYALVTLLVVSSTYLMVRWLASEDLTSRVGHILLTTAALYVNYYGAVALLGPVLFGLRKRPRAIGANMVLVAILALPLVPHVAHLIGRTGTLALPDVVPWRWFTGVVPVELIVGVGIVVVASRLSARRANRADPNVLLPRDVSLAFGWWLLAPVFFLLLTFAADISALTPRYIVSSMPGLALAFGVVVAHALGANRETYLVPVVALVAALTAFSTVHGTDAWVPENWRAVAAAIRETDLDPSTPILVNSGLVEASRPAWVADPDKLDYLVPVFHPYPVRGSLFALPFSNDGDAQAEIARRARIAHEHDFIVVVREPNIDMISWFAAYARDHTARYLISQGSISVAYFTRAR